MSSLATPKRLTDTPLQKLLTAASGTQPPAEALARAYIGCPRAKAIAIAALQKSGGDYDDCIDILSSAWMLIRDKYPSALEDAERTYQLTAAIAMRLAKRSAEGLRQRHRVVPLSVVHGQSAEASDFAAFGDHVNRTVAAQVQGSIEVPLEMLGVTVSHETAILQGIARDRLTVRFANTMRPSGVKQAVNDDDIVVVKRAAAVNDDKATHAEMFNTPTREMTVLQRLRRLSICSGIAQQSLRVQMQWDTQHWNDVLRQRDGAHYETGARSAVRRRDLEALMDAEQLHLTPDVLSLMTVLATKGAVEVAGMWWQRTQLSDAAASTSPPTTDVSPHQKLFELERFFPTLNLQCSRWRFREPAHRTVVCAYLKLRHRLVLTH